MIKKFKKVIISSLLATIVIFGAVAPMASAAGGSTRVDGYTPNFNYYGVSADSTNGSIRVQYLDSDTSKVVLYDANGIEAGSAVNANPVVSNQITTGETLLSVEFKDVTPGLYTIREFAGAVRSAASSVITLNPKTPESTIGWDPIALGTVHVTNLTPGSVVTLYNPFVSGEVPLQPTQTADTNGIANFTGIPNGTYYKVKQTFNALGSHSLTSYSNYYEYLSKNNLPSMGIVTNAQGDVTVSNAIPTAELRLYLPVSSITSTGSTTVTSDVYLSAIVPASGTITFPAAATIVTRYQIVEITSDGSDRADSFVIEPHAPTLALSSTGTGVVITGALPNATIYLYNNSNGYNDYGNADDNGNVTFNPVPAGKYVARQASEFNPCSYGDYSNEITVQKWMTRYLSTGWNTLSVPFALQTATLQAILGDKIASLDKAYAYDNTTSQWVALTTANQAQYLSKPQTALYINLLASNDEVIATFNATSDITPPSVLHISTGWNLVGPSLLNIGSSPKDFLTGNSFDVIPMLISPNGQGFVYNKSNNNQNYVLNTIGYWVYAKSATNLIGQISTGNVSDSNPWDVDFWIYND